MKKLLNLFLWFCVATILAQGCILGLSFSRGNLSQKSFAQIIALLNGIDIPGERLKNAIAAGQEVPIPTRQEILDAKVQASLELDSREKSLERWQRQLQTQQENYLKNEEDLQRRIREHSAVVDQFKRGVQEESLAEVQKILEVLAPEQAKMQILGMMQAGATADVVAIIKAMPEDKRKKILAEFTEGDDSAKLGELLNALRSADAKPVSAPTAPAGQSPTNA